MTHQEPGADARWARDLFVHESADVQSRDIGSDTKIWQYSIVLEGARIGRNCNVGAHCFIENDVALGDNVTVKCGVYIWDGIEVEDDVFIGPSVAFTNDKYPRSKAHPFKLIRTTIQKGAYLPFPIEDTPREMMTPARKYTERIDPGAVSRGVQWR